MKNSFASRRRHLPSSATVRTTAQGEVVGLVAENGAHVWRGIPYAGSTAGENRWRAPQPAPNWDGEREALHFAERCAQLTNDLDTDEGVKPGLVIGSEDCLALDIYAPATASGGALPVMVWIHGGGNVWGRSSTYDGSRLAHNESVIVVAVQYRVGPLGWFAHQALRDSAPSREDGSACFATLDLIASLKWVRDNIAEFGGNPDSVTIFGESAGGHNVVTLLASPLAAGLFHRAIVQSGAFDSFSLAEAEGLEGEALNPSKTISEKLNVSTADELRAVPVDQLLLAYERGPGFVDVPRVIQDGVVLPVGCLRDAFNSTETFNAVPLMMGTNRDEMKLFYVRDERLTKKVLGVFIKARDQDVWDAFTHYLTRLWRIRAVDETAAAMNAAGHDSVYSYRFDWDDGGRLLFMDFQKVFGATHGWEIPFVFNRFHHLGDADRFLFQKKTLSDRVRLSRAMGAYWASFARDGVPCSVGHPSWPRYREAGGSFLRLDTDNDGGIELLRGSDSLEEVAADLASDPRIDPSLIVRELDKWMFTRPVREQLRAALDGESPSGNAGSHSHSG